MTERRVTVFGAGPAGSAAAISARLAGADVRIFEKSVFPRHKVCGEFLSPGIPPLLERLGVAGAFADAKPHAIARFVLHFPRCSKQGRLRDQGFGLSRHRLDEILLDRVLQAGASLTREPAPEQADTPVVVATGRRFQGMRGGRLFGFKAHFTGPQNDAVELFFFDGCYVGVNGVEGGITNVCGLGPEEVLSKHGFNPDSLAAGFEPLRDRIAPLERSMDWLTTGPIFFRDRLSLEPQPGHYHAGDQLSFVDPFTGTGMLVALLSGEAAGRAAANGEAPAKFMAEIGRKLRPAMRVSELFRWSIASGLAEQLVRWVPASLLVSLTRPRLAA